MKFTLITASLLAMLSLTACDRPGGDASRTAPAVSPEPTAAPVSGNGATELAKGDSAVLGVLAAIDDNEIALAKQAIAQDLGGATGEFAQQMLHDHQANLEKTKSLGATESPRAQAMRAKGKAAVEALSKTLTLPDGKDAYRNAFMRNMVIDHGRRRRHRARPANAQFRHTPKHALHAHDHARARGAWHAQAPAGSASVP